MFSALWAKLWPYIVAIGAAFGAVLAIRQSGKTAARAADAAQRADAKKQSDKDVRDVNNEVAAIDDSAVDRELDQWGRNPKR